MLPAERRDVLEQGCIDDLGFPKQSDGAFQAERVPQRDGGDHQVKDRWRGIADSRRNGRGPRPAD
jgi:hypothetical protein